MANIINAGTNGVTVTGAASAVLNIQVGGTNALQIGTGATLTLSTPQVFPAGTAAAPSITTTGDVDTGMYFPAANQAAISAGGTVAAAFNSNGLFFRNRIINGDMRIDQRNAGAAVTHSGSANLYVLDRWVCNSTGTPQFSVQQVTDAPTGFISSSKLTTTTAGTPAAGDFSYYGQYIEGFNTADLNFGTASALTVTVSFWVKSSLTGTFGGTLKNSVPNRAYPFSYTINSANTWEYKTVTIPGDTTGTWLTDNGRGIFLAFDTGSGANNKGTAGAWNATNAVGVTGGVNLVATASATWQITGAQLETGSVATPFERRPYGTELALCQRYFLRVMSGGVDCAIICTRSSGTSSSFTIYTPVSLRASPTIGVPSGTSPVTNNGRLVLYRTSDFALSQNEVTAMSLVVWSGQNQVDIGIINATATGDYVYATYDTLWTTTALTLSSEL